MVDMQLLQVVNHLCTLHISPFLFDEEAEEVSTVIILLGGGDASLFIMLGGLSLCSTLLAPLLTCLQ